MSTKQSEKKAVETDIKQKPKQSAKKDKEKGTTPLKKPNTELDSEALTRKEYKKKRREEKRKNKKPRRRIFPIWLRIIVVLILCGVALALGLMIGYGVIGDGSPGDALKVETWQHIIDIVKKEE